MIDAKPHPVTLGGMDDDEATRLGREALEGWCWCGGADGTCIDAFVCCPFVFDGAQCQMGLGHLDACQTTVAVSADRPTLQVMRWSIAGFS